MRQWKLKRVSFDVFSDDVRIRFAWGMPIAESEMDLVPLVPQFQFGGPRLSSLMLSPVGNSLCRAPDSAAASMRKRARKKQNENLVEKSDCRRNK